MKITDVEPTLLQTGNIFVRVKTDEGVIGIGECSPMHGPVIAHFVDRALKPLIVGEDPRHIDRLWHKMLFALYKLGPQGAHPSAIAGVDIALWDILGKVTGLPVSVLLGGRYRDEVTMYRSVFGGGDSTVDEMVGRVEQSLQLGFRAIKILMTWFVGRRDMDPEKDWEMFKACKELCGDDVPLSFDANNGYSVPTAIRQGRRLESLGAWHYEEPVAQYDYPGLGRVADALDMPVAAGEHEYTRWQFRDLIEHGRVDILQPDVVKCGGITEMRKIAVLAETHNKDFVPHQTQTTIGTAANLHVVAALKFCDRPQEFTGPPAPELEDLFEEPLRFTDGRLTVPDKPGLGLELDERKLRKLAADR